MLSSGADQAALLASDASQVLERLKKRDAIMTFGGHSGPGLIQFCTDSSIPEFGGMSNIATTPGAVFQTTLPTEYLSSLSGGDLDDVFMVLLLGCNTAVAAEDGTTLQASLLSLGVDVVIAFPGYLHDRLGTAWAKQFWCFATSGHGAGLYDCDFWDSNPDFEPPSPLFFCNSASGELPSIEEAALCASAYVLYYRKGYGREDKKTIEDVVVLGDKKTEKLTPARFGATISGD